MERVKKFGILVASKQGIESQLAAGGVRKMESLVVRSSLFFPLHFLLATALHSFIHLFYFVQTLCLDDDDAYQRVFSSIQNPKKYYSTYHIEYLRPVHEALNVDEKIN